MKGSILVGIGVVLGLATGAGCLGDAPRGNPLDPLSDNYRDVGAVTGRATRFYPPHAPLDHVRVRLEAASPGSAPWNPVVVESGPDGRFTFADVPSGPYLLFAEREGFAPVLDTLSVRLGEQSTRDVRLNGLPRVAALALRTVHVSRWWPEEDLYLLEVVADVEDPDGATDVAAAWLEVVEAGFIDTLAVTSVPGRFTSSLPVETLPVGSLHALLGQTVVVHARDLAGQVNASAPRSLVRVIEETPVAGSPQGLATVRDVRPLLTWEPADLPFPFTYRLDVVRVLANVETVVHTAAGLASDQTAYRVPVDLARQSTYYWTLSVVDAFGNRSRSKEAGFQIE
jgi:hypothetical protein